jgi:outer membrane usher protein FimD/PapC
VPLAPLSYSVSGGVTQELGALSLALTAGYGNYYGGTGNNKNLALRASLGLSSAWKLILTVSGSRDGDQDGSRTDSGVASLGLRYRF